MDRIKIRLPKENSQTAVNVDTNINIDLSNTNRVLPVGEINRVLNIGDQFNSERQSSPYYRILGNISSLFTNVLINNSGLNSWEYLGDYTSPLRDGTFPPNPPANPDTEEEDLTFRESINQNLIEKDGWFGYIDRDYSTPNSCTFVDMEPSRNKFSFTPKNKIKNWELTITYPAASATTNMTNGGLLIIDNQDVLVGNRNMVAFATPVDHGLSQGDTVRLSDLNNPALDGDYTVTRIGLDNGDLKEYYFVVDIDSVTTPVSIGTNTRMKRIFAGQESTYYFRLFRKVATRVTPVIEDDDYETYQLPFARNFYGDPVTQFVFNEDVDVSQLTDNLGRPVSELYVTIIKTQTNLEKGGPVFTTVKSGIEMPFINNTTNFPNDVPDIRRVHFGNTPTPHQELENNVTIANSEFYGDVVEYNRLEVRENILAEVRHTFNTLNRLNGVSVQTSATGTTQIEPRNEGYFYKPHHRLEIREFSNYVEQGDSSTFGMPTYAEDLGDGRYLWRDLLDIGVSDVSQEPLNYPFLNGAHYLNTNICLALRRQDPYGEYGLFYSDFPQDPIGDRAPDNFEVKRTEDAC